MATKKLMKHLNGFKRHPKYMNRAERVWLGVHGAEKSWKRLWSELTAAERKEVDNYYWDLHR